ncbi:hypothetical protein AYK26_01875 [Euryarchaeota archaeon SM23-78]|nr:MAG: hypothetical protein AYK26_01875 [Euryarchaeota archaeon SM23-78]MBW3000334.1 hypothetical protein [Candidatus Woesearchaeota archaeon]
MAKKKDDSPLFEIIVVLAIVVIVAITGQVLMRYETRDTTITGLAVADFEEERMGEDEFLDIGVSDIIVNPPSPIIGQPFEVKVFVANQGQVEIKTPFYVELKLIPNIENAEPTVITSAMTQFLKPGEESSATFRVATVTREGPLKLIATADSTVKLDDDNPANDMRSKTVIINIQ